MHAIVIVGRLTPFPMLDSNRIIPSRSSVDAGFFSLLRSWGVDVME